MELERKKTVKDSELFAAKKREDIIEYARNQWELLSVEDDNLQRKCDRDLYTSILYNLEIRNVYLDPTITLVKFSHIVGTNTTYLSNVINRYFKCNLKQLINKYRIEYAKYLLDYEHIPISRLPKRCGFSSRSVFYASFKKVIGVTPLQYVISSQEDESEINNIF